MQHAHRIAGVCRSFQRFTELARDNRLSAVQRQQFGDGAVGGQHDLLEQRQARVAGQCVAAPALDRGTSLRRGNDESFLGRLWWRGGNVLRCRDRPAAVHGMFMREQRTIEKYLCRIVNPGNQ